MRGSVRTACPDGSWPDDSCDVVDDGLVGLDAEHGLGKLNLADCLPFIVVKHWS